MRRSEGKHEQAEQFIPFGGGFGDITACLVPVWMYLLILCRLFGPNLAVFTGFKGWAFVLPLINFWNLRLGR